MTETTEGEPNRFRDGMPYRGAEERAPTLAEARRMKTEQGLGLASRPVNDEAREPQPLRAFVR